MRKKVVIVFVVVLVLVYSAARFFGVTKFPHVYGYATPSHVYIVCDIKYTRR
jgi:hypothetical protein